MQGAHVRFQALIFAKHMEQCLAQSKYGEGFLGKYRTQIRSNFSKYQLPTFLPQMIHTLLGIRWARSVVNLNTAAAWRT